MGAAVMNMPRPPVPRSLNSCSPAAALQGGKRIFLVPTFTYYTAATFNLFCLYLCWRFPRPAPPTQVGSWHASGQLGWHASCRVHKVGAGAGPAGAHAGPALPGTSPPLPLASSTRRCLLPPSLSWQQARVQRQRRHWLMCS